MSFQSKGKSPWLKLRFIGIALVIIIMLTSLGVWQLRRASEKRAIEAVLKEHSVSKPLWVGEAKLQLPASEYRQGIARGRFDSAHTVFLDNQIHKGQAGYYVLMPLRLTGGEDAILINRGWVPMGLDRRQLPIINTPDLQVTIRGTLRRPPQAPLFLGDEKEQELTGWPRRVQYVDLKRLQSQLGYTLQPLILYLAPNEPYGFVRQWSMFPVTIGTSAQRHIAYAVQWFVIAVVAVAVFIILYRRYFDDIEQPHRDKG